MKYEEANTIFKVKIGKEYKYVFPVNGEEFYNDIGFSHGFVHFADPNTKAKLGWSGIQWFEDNAERISI